MNHMYCQMGKPVEEIDYHQACQRMYKSAISISQQMLLCPMTYMLLGYPTRRH